jgi:hypothetical protein
VLVSSDLDRPGRLPHQQGTKRGEAGLPRRATQLGAAAPGPGLERTGRGTGRHQGGAQPRQDFPPYFRVPVSPGLTLSLEEEEKEVLRRRILFVLFIGYCRGTVTQGARCYISPKSTYPLKVYEVCFWKEQ